jgi:hypothetical protein
MELKIYTYQFPGMALGGRAVVIARDSRRARHMLLKDPNLQSLKLESKDVELLSSTNVVEAVIYVDNGDY